MTTIKQIAFIAFLGIVVFASGCKTMRSPIPIAAVQNLQISSKKTDIGTELSISGIYFNSSSAVGNVETNIYGHCLLIQIFPRLPSRTTSGKIDLKIMLPNNVDTVEFGQSGTVIWSRNE